jgi:eukaryotic-like serine/threonine-protein kinase
MPEMSQNPGFEQRETPPAADSAADGCPPPSTLVEEAPPPSTATTAGRRVSMEYGRYTLLKEHARGGLGKVSLARDTKLGRTVALKEIRPDRTPDEEALQRFINEAAITGLLEHPGIVPIYSLDEDQRGKPYYAMRFIEGQSLQLALEQYHARAKPPSTRAPETEFRKLLSHFIAVCNAVGYAHSKGVIHRDLKPDNVMLGDYGETLVVDWGLAKRIGTPAARLENPAGEVRFASLVAPEIDRGTGLTETTDFVPVLSPQDTPLTHAGRIMGTPAYMSPEQARGDIDQLGPETDIYALGGILYALLTGQPPFTGSVFDILQKVQQGSSPPLPSAVKKDAPKALGAVCVKAMSPAPKTRYASAKELAAEVESWLADEPTAVFTEPWWTRGRRWVKKHQLLVGVCGAALFATAIILAIVSGIIGEAYRDVADAYVREQASKQVAQSERANAERSAYDAREAVDTYYTKISQSKLLGVPRMEPLRRDLLQAAMKYYEKFVAERQGDTGLELELAKAQVRLAGITNEIGSKTKAVKLCRDGLGRLEAMSRRGVEPRIDVLMALTESYHTVTQIELDLSREDTARQASQQLANLLDQLLTVHLHQLSLDQRERLFRLAVECPFGQPAQVVDHLELLVKETPGLASRRAMLTLSRKIGEISKRMAVGQLSASVAVIQQARTIATELQREEPQNTEHQARLGDLEFYLGLAQLQLGRYAVAQQALEKSQQWLTRAVDEHPDVIAHQLSLNRTEHELGLLFLYAGQNTKSESLYKRLIPRQQRLVQTYPDVPMYRWALAKSHGNLGQLYYLNMQEVVKGTTELERGIRLYEQLDLEIPNDLALQWDLSKCYSNLGNAYRFMEQWSPAETTHLKAVAFKEKLLRARPQSIDFCASLGGEYGNLGYLYTAMKRPQEAVVWLNRSVGLLENALAKEPLSEKPRQFYSTALSTRAQLYHDLHQYQEALHDWDQCIAAVRRTQPLALCCDEQLGRVKTLVALGDHIRAAAQANTLSLGVAMSNLPPDAQVVVQTALAKLLAKCTVLALRQSWWPDPESEQRREAYGKQAVSLLRKMRVRGFFSQAAQSVQWWNDADLVPLRQREDFRQLLRRR